MPGRKLFPDSVIPLPAGQGLATQGLLISPAEPRHRAAAMSLHFALSLPEGKQRELEDRVAAGEVIPFAEQARDYAADPAAADRLARWLTAQGYTIDQVTPDHTTVYATAPAGTIEASLGVTMVRVTRDGHAYTAACDTPSLPDDVGGPVFHIGGLQPFLRPNKHYRISHHKPPPDGVPPDGVPDDPTDTAAPQKQKKKKKKPAAADPTQPPYTVPAILKAYGADGLGLTGAGQEIAILIDTVPLDSDLTLFWRANGVSADLGRVTKINVAGGTLPSPEGEESLDVEWTSGIAPGAGIRVYACGSLSFTALDQALDRIIADAAQRPALRQLSISLGLGETYLQGPSGEMATQHQKFLKLAAAGVNVFVSSGDAGSNPDDTGHSSKGPLQVEYEASDPCVIGVGGTSLRLGADGHVAAEVAWPGSGGGKSVDFPRPAWQVGNGVPAGGQRLVPDVAGPADPNEGALLYLNGQKEQIGGTSWSAPLWAGFCALINEARTKAGKGALPFLNPLLYPLLGTPCFRDITQGSNGAYSAGPGYDLVTGLGVPNVAQLVSRLQNS
ncbi:S53 family peptidase [Nitrospirillum amazonense]|uniref:Kumamolisin n=1 Tax=Nitrospirillum amazonense TaxID=28077 RepID=A0A560KA62_9PROT|nr:S53 family peptidase [Nitrospirillum amazonense]MDG3441423.1 S53 family peptidase [Nitrospirillum amazonense]TWB80086.1 kumamolisin [Nitrospirillum amazonense]